MRFLVFSAILLSVSSLLIFSVLYNNIRFVTRGAVIEKTASSNLPPQKNDIVASPTATKPKFVPPKFNGPNAKPGIIGPSGPPPNY